MLHVLITDAEGKQERYEDVVHCTVKPLVTETGGARIWVVLDFASGGQFERYGVEFAMIQE